MKMYSITKRKNYFYVQFKDDDTNRYGTAKSVDSLLKKLGDTPHHVTKRPEADSIVRRAIEKGLDGNEKKQDPLFIDYLQDFWNYDTSFYVRKQNKKKANSINRDHVYNMAACVRNHVKPYLPNGLKCSQVKKRHIEDIQNHAINDYSVNVWLSTLKCLSVPIKELIRAGILMIDPLMDLERYTAERQSSVGSLTERETDKLIFQMYHDTMSGELDKRIYLATCLASASGMRKGEVLGLHVSDIRFPNAEDNAEGQALVIVRSSFAVQQGMKGTKSKKDRTVFIDRWLADELVEFAETNPYGNGLVFYSDINPVNPLFPTVINKWFNRELERIGISEEERTRRHIVFHSLRHYANSEMRTRIGDEKTQLIMGHTSTVMTDRYDTEDKAQRVYQIGREVGSLIRNPKEKEA